MPDQPVFLIVVSGNTYQVGKKQRRYKRRQPAFYLVSAIRQALPLPVEQILAWLWQRWELEVAHREMKTGLGLGEKQCWNHRSAITSVQWSAWVYAVLVLAGIRAWGSNLTLKSPFVSDFNPYSVGKKPNSRNCQSFKDWQSSTVCGENPLAGVRHSGPDCSRTSPAWGVSNMRNS
jgi:hypothetical protein